MSELKAVISYLDSKGPLISQRHQMAKATWHTQIHMTKNKPHYFYNSGIQGLGVDLVMSFTVRSSFERSNSEANTVTLRQHSHAELARSKLDKLHPHPHPQPSWFFGYPSSSYSVVQISCSWLLLLWFNFWCLLSGSKMANLLCPTIPSPDSQLLRFTPGHSSTAPIHTMLFYYFFILCQAMLAGQGIAT